jgi:hypothetical protein
MRKHRGGDVPEATTGSTSVGETTQNALNSANKSIESAKDKVSEQASSMFDGLTSWFGSSETPQTPQPAPAPAQTAGRRRRKHRKSRRTKRR